MGRINLPCNMDAEEAESYFSAFDPYLSDREEEFVSEIFDHYLFYETWGRRNHREFTCTHAGCGHFARDKDESPSIFRYHHGEVAICPNCGNQVTLISLGRMRSFATLEGFQRVVICRAGPNGALLLTAGWAKKEYSYHDLRPIVWFDEKARICLLPGKRMEWRKNREWNGWIYVDAGWNRENMVKEPFNPSMNASDGSYWFICPEVIGDTAMKYCRLEDWYDFNSTGELMQMQQPVRQVVKYLSAYTKYPVMEMAVRLGMLDAVTDLVMKGKKNANIINWDGKTIADFLRIGKPEAKLFLKNQYNIGILQEYQKAKKNKAVSSLSEFVRIVDASGGKKNMPILIECAEKAGCSLQQASNYISRHKEIVNGKSILPGRMLTTWRDYLDMGKKLNYDLSLRDVAMPKNLQIRHDAAAETVRAIEEVEQTEKYQKRVNQMRKLYEFRWNDFCILVPISAEEIVREGKKLRHCVAGYAPRHVDGKVDILFLRNVGSIATPLVTIEMKPRKTATDPISMVQIHGYRNEAKPGAVDPRVAYKEFLDIWTEWMRQGSRRDRKGNPIIIDKKEKTA